MIGLCLLVGAGALADEFDPADLGERYGRRQLEEHRSLYQPYIQNKIVNVLKEALRGEEWTRVNQAVILFPLIHEGQNTPLGFYAGGVPSQIVLPILSVKFLDDLCIAAAWLETNGYHLETLNNYLGMLKYQNAASFPGGVFPSPHQALRIPPNALDDERVKSLSNKLFNSILAFIVAHEFGHVVHAHPGALEGIPKTQIQDWEKQADAFAITCMHRINLPPVGVGKFFTADAYLALTSADFSRVSAYRAHRALRASHPTSAERMDALANGIERGIDALVIRDSEPAQSKKLLVGAVHELREIAKKLRDPELLELIRQRSLYADLESLAPQRISLEPPPLVAPQPPAAGTDEPADFSGQYKGSFYTHGATERSPITTTLEQQGAEVRGAYVAPSSRGEIQGFVTGRTLEGIWKEGGGYGKIKFELNENGNQFAGTWGYQQSTRDGGDWDGAKTE